MPRRALADLQLWEQRLVGCAAKWDGWSVARDRDRIRVRLRQGGKAVDSVLLPKPLAWTEASEPDATLWIRQLRAAWSPGQSLKQALEAITQKSDRHGDELGHTWSETQVSFKRSLVEGRNQIQEATWRDNYAPYLGHALKVLSGSRKPKDGYGLLQATLANWEGKPSSRQACCWALRNWMDHAISRFGVASCWAISQSDIAELRGRPSEKRVKAVLTDAELLALIRAIEAKNKEWASVVMVLAATGCRTVELSHLQVKQREVGGESVPGLFCTYRKVSGRNRTEPRWLYELPLMDADGSQVRFNLAERMAAGELPWPKARDGSPRKLDGHYVESFLKRQPAWRALVKACADRGEWCRAYSTRDAFSARAHRLGVETAQICRAMGHGLQAHSRAYRTASDDSAAAAFAI